MPTHLILSGVPYFSVNKAYETLNKEIQCNTIQVHECRFENLSIYSPTSRILELNSKINGSKTHRHVVSIRSKNYGFEGGFVSKGSSVFLEVKLV